MRLKLFVFLLLLPACMIKGRTFHVANTVVSHDKNESVSVCKAIDALCADIGKVTGTHPEIKVGKAKGARIIIGTYGESKQISALVKKGVLKETDLKGHWESYVIPVTKDKNPCLVIAGSDRRGTI